MNKKVLIFIAIVSFLLIAVVLLLLYYSQNPERKGVDGTNNNSDLIKAEKTAEDFIKDFTTYKLSDTSDYNDRIIKYISTGYTSSFKERFLLPAQRYINSSDLKDYSTYESSEIKDSLISEDDNLAEITISYRAKRVDAPRAPTEFTEEKTIFLRFKKTGTNFLITNMQFEVTN